MRKKLIALLGIMMTVIIATVVCVSLLPKKTDDNKNKKLTVVTSFYPMYIATENVIGDVDNVELINLTENHTGCLHDYQMTTNDMRKLENADIFIMNGGGMESFVEDIVKSYPNIKVIDTSKGLSFIKGGHTHEGEEAKVDEGNNAHTWLDTQNYKKQIENIKNGLCEYDKSNANSYKKYANLYEKEISKLQKEIKETVVNSKGHKVIIFHEAFAYIAKEMGLEVIHLADMDDETTLSAGEIAEVVDEIKSEDVKMLLCEDKTRDGINTSITTQTGTKTYVINPLTNGEKSKNAYLDGMRANLEVLKDALEEESRS